MLRNIVRFACGAICCLFLLVAPQSAPAVSSATGVGERVKLQCKTTRHEYELTCSYTVYETRLLLVAVIDKNKKPHRIARKLVKAGSETFTWKGKKSKFQKLIRACAAIHNTKRERETVASDCDSF